MCIRVELGFICPNEKGVNIMLEGLPVQMENLGV